MFFRSLVYEIIEKSGNIDVYVVNEDAPPPKLKMQSATYASWLSIISAMMIIAICTIIGLPAREWLEPETVLMIYLAGVVIIATSSEPGISIFSALISVICYNFFFIYPYYSMGTYHLRDLVTLGVLLLTGLVISTQTSRLRQQHLFTRQREKYTAELYDLSRKLIVTPGKSRIAKVVSHHIGEIFESAATVWVPDDNGDLELVSHPGLKAELKEESVATWAFNHNQIAGLGTNTMPSARGYYIPLSNNETVFGVLGIIPKDPEKTFSIEEVTLLESLAIQTAWAFERVIIADKMHKDKEKSPGNL